MKRFLSVFLPAWPLDRLRWKDKQNTSRPLSPNAPAGLPLDEGAGPTAVVASEGRQHILVTINQAAAELGMTPGMPLAKARAIASYLREIPHDPSGERADLERLAVLLQRFSPLVALEADGLALDVSGCARLWGGEAEMQARIAALLSCFGIAARFALADSYGAAWAIARYGTGGIVAVGEAKAVLAPLPLKALRLPHDLPSVLHRLGFSIIADLYDMPRAVVARRFGRELVERLQQALGEIPELLHYLPEPAPIMRSLTFMEPIGRPEDLAQALHDGLLEVSRDLELMELGARRIEAVYTRSDGSKQVIRIGTSAPNRDANHLMRLFREKIAAVDPGFGVEMVTVHVLVAEPFLFRQGDVFAGMDQKYPDVSELMDRIINRLGAESVYGIRFRESDLPERAIARSSVLVRDRTSVTLRHERPLRLLSPPEFVETIALLPDYPPVQFQWRKRRHRIVAADGPERLFGEWWRRRGEADEIRDYYRVENEEGERFWLFRRRFGDEGRWYIHGIFA